MLTPSLENANTTRQRLGLNKSRLLDKGEKVFSYLFECTEAEVNSLLPDLFLAIENCCWSCIILLSISNGWEEAERTGTRRDGEFGFWGILTIVCMKRIALQKPWR